MNLQPTFTGVVVSTQDALILFQAVIDGILPQITRRPHDRERSELIRSGNVFIFNEQQSGIKRWTDGIIWSPSRIYENFLLYRQLEKSFSHDSKKRSAKRSKKSGSYLDDSQNFPYTRPRKETNDSGGLQDMLSLDAPIGDTNTISRSMTASQLEQQMNGIMGSNQSQKPSIDNNGLDEREMVAQDMYNRQRRSFEPRSKFEDEDELSERTLVGSLVDSHAFKTDGLIKRTISIVVHGETHHLVSYYNLDEARSKRFQRPSKAQGLMNIKISEELMSRQNFRVPLGAGQNGHENTRATGIRYAQPMAPFAQSYYGPPDAPAPRKPVPMDFGYDIDPQVDPATYYRPEMSSTKQEYDLLSKHMIGQRTATLEVTQPPQMLQQQADVSGTGYVSGYRPFGSGGLSLVQGANPAFPLRSFQPLPQQQLAIAPEDKLVSTPVEPNGNKGTTDDNTSSPSLPIPQNYPLHSYIPDSSAVFCGTGINAPRQLPDSVRRQHASQGQFAPERQFIATPTRNDNTGHQQGAGEYRYVSGNQWLDR